jgi:hypothetical protein
MPDYQSHSASKSSTRSPGRTTNALSAESSNTTCGPALNTNDDAPAVTAQTAAASSCSQLGSARCADAEGPALR